MAAAKKYDLILTDYGMPGMNGIEVTEKLKVLHPGTPVVLVTGWDEDELRDHAADFVIQKPLTLARLREVLGSALPAE